MAKKTMTEIGKRLNKLIKDNGYTQQEFADKCNFSKDTITSHFYSENMSVDYIKKYAEVLEVSTDYLIFGETDNNKERQYEDRIPLKEVNESIMLLMKYFGKAKIIKEDNGCTEEVFVLKIYQSALIEKMKKVLKLMDLLEEDDGSITEELEKSLLTIIKAENLVVEKIDEEIFVYDKEKQTIFNIPKLKENGICGTYCVVDNDMIENLKRTIESEIEGYNKSCDDCLACKFEYDEEGHLLTILDFPF